MLNILQLQSINDGVKVQAAIQFKNHVSRHWPQVCMPAVTARTLRHTPVPQEEDVVSPISDQDRNTVKSSLVSLMAAVGKTLRSLLGEALGTIADHDFPDQWPSMCQELVSKINTSDMAVTNGILEASSAAFKKFDGAFDNGMSHSSSCCAAATITLKPLRRHHALPPGCSTGGLSAASHPAFGVADSGGGRSITRQGCVAPSIHGTLLQRPRHAQPCTPGAYPHRPSHTPPAYSTA